MTQPTVLISGDALVLSIAAASIIAKVTRDRLMGCVGAAHPGYGFERHMGYSVPEHFDALNRLGPCVHHRRRFAPVAALLGVPEAAPEVDPGGDRSDAPSTELSRVWMKRHPGRPGRIAAARPHDRPGVADAYRTMITAAGNYGKFPGMAGVYNETIMPRYIEMGARFILSGQDAAFMAAGAAQRTGFLRKLSF